MRIMQFVHVGHGSLSYITMTQKNNREGGVAISFMYAEYDKTVLYAFYM